MLIISQIIYDTIKTNKDIVHNPFAFIFKPPDNVPVRTLLAFWSLTMTQNLKLVGAPFLFLK